MFIKFKNSDITHGYPCYKGRDVRNFLVIVEKLLYSVEKRKKKKERT